jgi:hypothetical protein
VCRRSWGRIGSTDRRPYGRVPEAATEDAQIERSAFGGGEDEVLLAWVRVEMCGEFVGEEWREAHGVCDLIANLCVYACSTTAP